MTSNRAKELVGALDDAREHAGTLTDMGNAIGNAIRAAIDDGVPASVALRVAACILITECRMAHEDLAEIAHIIARGNTMPMPAAANASRN